MTLWCVLQLLVEAYDTAYPTETASATVTITVAKNEFGPVYDQSPYCVTINETLTINNCFLTVSATDQDGDTLTYSASLDFDTLKATSTKHRPTANGIKNFIISGGSRFDMRTEHFHLRNL